jgi:endonuclease/exonuclease/phosphatase family metal-dependent hydrolase
MIARDRPPRSAEHSEFLTLRPMATWENRRSPLARNIRRLHPALRVAGVLLTASTAAPAMAEPGAALDLKIASYNVQFVMPDLPVLGHLIRDIPWQKPNVELRARAIGTALACLDVIALQETINDRRRAELLDQLEADGHACGKPSRLPSGRMFETIAGPNLPDGSSLLPLLDDELTLASRLPVESVDMLAFHEAAGADELAAKGVLHARLVPGPAPDDRLDVFTTHLQADADEGGVRRRQIEELAAFVRSRARAGGPVLVMGDFNLSGGDVDRADPSPSTIFSSARWMRPWRPGASSTSGLRPTRAIRRPRAAPSHACSRTVPSGRVRCGSIFSCSRARIGRGRSKCAGTSCRANW